MKLGWSLAAIGTSLALGLSAAQAGEPNWLAPVVRVESDGAAAAPSAAPAVAMPTGQVGGQDCNGGCNQGCNTCGGCAEIFTPPMIGNDLPANTYNGQFLRNNPLAYALAPQAQRGAFKISDNESARPEDRVFAYYTYFNRVTFPGFQLVPAPAGAAAPGLAAVGRAFNTDVHRETVGFEKTFLGGDASIGVRVNVIQRDGDVQDDDFGDTTIIGKYTLINRENLLVSIGLAVTAPTGTANSAGTGGEYRSVLFQPYSGFIWNHNRFYLQGFNAIIVSTDERDPRFATYDLGTGYRLYQSECCKDQWLTYVIPTAEVHANFAATKEGFANRLDTAFPDSLITTVGVHIGLGCKANLALGAGLPLSGPKLYDVSGMAQLNWRF